MSIALLLVALALGVDNLAVSLGIGVSGVHGAMRVRVAVIFGLFEAGMPLLGMAAGRTVAGGLGSGAPWLGGGLLAAVGVYQLIEWARGRGSPGDAAAPGSWGTGRLLVSGLAMSIDNLVVGFALGVVAQGVKICVDTIVQQYVDDAYLGRVFSLYDMLFNVALVAGAAAGAPFMPLNGKSYALVTVVAFGYLAAAATFAVLNRGQPRPAPEPSEPTPARG